jgi:hypothetical protein
VSAAARAAIVGAAIVAVLAAVAAVLWQSEPRLAGTNNARLAAYPILIEPGKRFCQTGEVVPADAARMELEAGTEGRPGPELRVRIGAHHTRVPAGYRDGPVSVPLPAGAERRAELCVRNEGTRRVFLGGQDAATALPAGLATMVSGEPLAAVARVLYWRAGEETAWSVAGAAFERWAHVTAMGAATPWLAIALLVGACAAAIALALRGRAGPVACGAVAVAAAAGWAFTTPAFHVPDEPQHVAYAQYLAETGELPRPVPAAVFSPEEGAVFEAIAFNNVVSNDTGRPAWAEAADAGLAERLAAVPGTRSEGGGTNTTNNPPLYYGLQVVPLKLAAGGDFLDRLLAMRLVSALLAGATVAFVLLFLRDLLPGAPWAWAAGALALAVQPLLGFISGGVNNDAGMYAAGAAVLWLVARVLRRGLDRGSAIGLGAALGLGVVTKVTLLAFVPGLLVVLAILLARAAPSDRRRVLALAGVAAGVAALPLVVYVVLNATVWDRGLWTGSVSGPATSAGGGTAASPMGYLSYLWQFYLPRLPFMTELQAGLPVYNVWFKGLIGRYGWLDTTPPEWTYSVAAAIFAVIVALAGAGLWRARAALVRRRVELLAYATLVAGFVAVVGWAGYTGRLTNGFIFEQTRYMLPLAGFYAVLVALAVRGAGRALGPAVGAALVILACGHAVLSALLVADRFYA